MTDEGISVNILASQMLSRGILLSFFYVYFAVMTQSECVLSHFFTVASCPHNHQSEGNRK